MKHQGCFFDAVDFGEVEGIYFTVFSIGPIVDSSSFRGTSELIVIMLRLLRLVRMEVVFDDIDSWRLAGIETVFVVVYVDIDSRRLEGIVVAFKEIYWRRLVDMEVIFEEIDSQLLVDMEVRVEDIDSRYGLNIATTFSNAPRIFS